MAQISRRLVSRASGLISFEKLAEKFAGSVAVISDGRTWTYEELDERANQFARLLIEHGVKPGDRIGLLLDRSAETYITLLAVMKAGAAYVPLATAFPEDRMALIIDDAGVKLVISLRAYSARVEQMPVPHLLIDACSAEISQHSKARLISQQEPPILMRFATSFTRPGRPGDQRAWPFAIKASATSCVSQQFLMVTSLMTVSITA